MSQLVPEPKGVIRRDAVRLVAQPAMVDCASADHGKGPISVVPLLDGDKIAGLEIRCSCGASTIVECIYETENKP